MNKTCRNCKVLEGCRDSASSWVFLFIGLLATIAIRAVNIVIDFNLLLAKVSWYIGIVGFLIYFLFQFRQRKRMRKFLIGSGIVQKLKKRDALSAEESDFLSSVLCGLRSRKDVINYFMIFSTSAVALLLGIYQDFIR